MRVSIKVEWIIYKAYVRSSMFSSMLYNCMIKIDHDMKCMGNFPENRIDSQAKGFLGYVFWG